MKTCETCEERETCTEICSDVEEQLLGLPPLRSETTRKDGKRHQPRVIYFSQVEGREFGVDDYMNLPESIRLCAGFSMMRSDG